MLEDPPATDEVRRNDADVRSCPDRYTCGAGFIRRCGPGGDVDWLIGLYSTEVVVTALPKSDYDQVF